ncbi:MAG: hypothetical protein IJ587_10330 [Synergistaceae bacterium]|nr:hypothetical protein [Synergistaceae bacterium]
MKKRLIETVDDFDPKFLWYPFIPFEAPSVFQGRAGFGKTTIICLIMAELSNGIYPPRLIHGAIKDQLEPTEWERYAVNCSNCVSLQQDDLRDGEDGMYSGYAGYDVHEGYEISSHLGVSVECIDDEDLEAQKKSAPPMNLPFRRPLGEPMKMIYISRENKYGYVKKKYQMFGGQDGFLRIIEEIDDQFTTSQAKIRELIEDAKFAVIDPIFPFVEGSLLNNDDTAMMMHNFEVVASETGAAFLLLNNLVKDPGSDYNTGIGASNLKNVARSLFKIDKSKKDNVRYIESVKNNYAPDDGKIGILMDDLGRPEFLDYSRLKKMKKLESEASIGPKEAEAMTFLREILKDGALPSANVFDKAEEIGIAKITLNRAKSKAGVVSIRGKGNSSVWTLED